ncbi:hypothetical protein COK19_07660 [Bacillus cereus]|nr:hypothetical protein COJ55_00270 [Bacillus cereus]PFR29111.1 hypothetical protein COK19_07660 [Bacillus cereus]PGZ17322.1 hypothetical protein COE46_09005 [Bacillus cereus]
MSLRFSLPRYLWAVRPPLEDSAKAMSSSSRFRFWGSTARKSPIGSTNNQWGMKPPLIKVSLYPAICGQ